jgi:hypothetical protein
MMRQAIDTSQSIVSLLLTLGDTYTSFYEHHKNYFRMMHFFETPQFHKQVSEEMMRVCDSVTQRLWDMVIREIKKGVEMQMVRDDINPVEISIMLWSNANTLLMRIDSQHEMWKETMNIDLKHTLRLSTLLLIESVLTDKGKKELYALQKKRNK